MVIEFGKKLKYVYIPFSNKTYLFLNFWKSNNSKRK